jgi:hypothetical protein
MFWYPVATTIMSVSIVVPSVKRTVRPSSPAISAPCLTLIFPATIRSEQPTLM